MRITCLFGVAIYASFVFISTTFGQSEEPKKPEAKSGAPTAGAASPQQAEEPKKPTEPGKRDVESKGLLSAPGRDGMVNRRLAALLRLRAEINDKIKLGEEKRKNIDRMFDDYMTGLLGPEKGPRATPPPEDMTPPQEIPRLTKELEAAKSSGDKDAEKAIQSKINAAKMVLEPSIFDPPTFFLNALAAELDKEQNEVLDKMAKRWLAIRAPEIVQDDDLKRLNRSFRDPELELPDEERQELSKIIVKTMKAVPFADRKDSAIMAEAAAKLRPELFEKLKPDQRRHVEETISMLEKWNKEGEAALAAALPRLRSYSPEGGSGSSKPKNEAPRQGP